MLDHRVLVSEYVYTFASYLLPTWSVKAVESLLWVIVLVSVALLKVKVIVFSVEL